MWGYATLKEVTQLVTVLARKALTAVIYAGSCGATRSERSTVNTNVSDYALNYS